MVHDLVAFVGALVGSSLGAYLAVRSLLSRRAEEPDPVTTNIPIRTPRIPPQWSGSGVGATTSPPASPKRAPVYGTPEKAALHERRSSSPLLDRLTDDGATLTRIGGRPE